MTDYIEDASDELKYSAPRITYSDVAAKLLQDNFLLTALELHTELVESGREVPQLKEFFSNPGNFERPSIDVSLPIARSPSQATLDSLDLTRLSEDGERGSDVAVLEFELRKARETINSLRANLTQAADFEISSLDLGCEKLIREDPLKPHEKRALNFLINEYLLQQDYKLTSITFADEIPEQDFEDWDDVGLNIPRPAGLISIYRGEGVTNIPKTVSDGKTQTIEILINDADSNPDEKAELVSAKDEEVSQLKKQILALETDKVNYQKLYDAALASLNSLSSPTSDMPSSETTLYTLQHPFKEDTALGGTLQINCVDLIDHDVLDHDRDLPLPQSATQNYYGSSVSTHSMTPDQFEMIGSDKNGGSSQKDGSNTSSFEPAILADDIVINSPKSIPDSPPNRKESITTLEDTFSLNENPEHDWPRGQFLENVKTSSRDGSIVGGKTEAWINSNIPGEYKSALMKSCNLPYTKGNELLSDIAGNSQAITFQRLVYVVSATLPKIVPNLLLVKRDEVIGLLVCAIFLHPEQSQRDKLLQLLLNLKKKMEKEDRALIISGLVVLLQWNTETNSGLDSDLLGLCWEMLNSKSVEKRLLGAEACIALAPYISLELVSSLLLSMAVSMCESSEPLIRRQGLLAAVLVAPSSPSPAKARQLEALLHTLLLERDAPTVATCVRVLAPVLARSALLNGIFHKEFCLHLLEKLKTALCENRPEASVAYLQVLNSTINVALVYVVNVPVLKERDPMNELSYGELSDRRASEYLHSSIYCDPKFLVEDQVYNPYQLINIFYELSETENLSWPERDWFIDTYINTLLDNLGNNFKSVEDIGIVSAYLDLFESVCSVFGPRFSQGPLRAHLEAEVLRTELQLARLEGAAATAGRPALVGPYLAVLAALGDEQSLGNVIKRWSICSGMCSIPCAVLGIPIVWFSNKRKNLLDVTLSALWESVVHASEQVRALTADLLTYVVRHATLAESLLSARIVPAIVTLVGDSAVSVKCKAISGLGAVVSRAGVPVPLADKCWVSLEGLAREERSGGALGLRATTRLLSTLRDLMAEPAGHPATANKVLPHLCMLCYSPILSSDNTLSVKDFLAGLLPALQMATHENMSEHFVHNILLPSLKNLSHVDSLNSEHRSAVEALIHKVSVPSREVPPPPSTASPGLPALPALLANPESVGRRVSQMFQQSKPAMNLHNIFKKKS